VVRSTEKDTKEICRTPHRQLARVTLSPSGEGFARNTFLISLYFLSPLQFERGLQWFHFSSLLSY
jgi:hypothetical protein